MGQIDAESYIFTRGVHVGGDQLNRYVYKV